jgi:hypothetical protein
MKLKIIRSRRQRLLIGGDLLKLALDETSRDGQKLKEKVVK